MKPPSPDGPAVSPNQVVAWNMAYFRKAADLTQQELGERLGWSGAVVSAAERSWDGSRVRQFTADDMTVIATALGIPVIALFLPPPGANVWPLPPFAPAEPEGPEAGAYRERLATADLDGAEDYRHKCRETLTFMLERMLDKAREL